MLGATQPLCLCLGIYVPSFAVQHQISSTPSLNLSFFPKYGDKLVCPKGAMNISLSQLFSLNKSRPCPFIQGFFRGRQIQKTLGTLGCPALVLVTRSCYCLCLPAGFTESQGMNMNRHMEESFSTASEFRGQASVGSSKKMLLHGKLGTNCFLLQGLSQCPY